MNQTYFVRKLHKRCKRSVTSSSSLSAFCRDVADFEGTCQQAAQAGEFSEHFSKMVVECLAISGAVAGASAAWVHGRCSGWSSRLGSRRTGSVGGCSTNDQHTGPRVVCSGTALMQGGTCGVQTVGVIPALKFAAVVGAVLGAAVGGKVLYEVTKQRMQEKTQRSLTEAMRQIQESSQILSLTA